MASPFRFQEPITKISSVTLGQPVTLEISPGKRISSIILTATVVKAAIGAGVKGYPLPSDAFGEIRFNINGNTNRKRTAAQLFGYTGLNSLNYKGNGGTVVYSQVGNANLSTVPVLIGSPDDTTQQGLLTANTITTAVFELPLIFAEDFRKEYAASEVMALVTGFADGSNLGAVIVEADVPANANITSVAVAASLEYDELVAARGSTIMLSKEKILSKQYAAAGDVEVGDQLINKEILQRLSLIAPDAISKVVVKQGSRILRNVTKAQNDMALIKAGYNRDAITATRFDIEFDVNDDPNSAPVLNPNQELSVVVTIPALASGAQNITILPSYYGAVE